MGVTRNEVEAQLNALGDFHRFFTTREISCLHEVLAAGERVHAITSGLYESKTWVVVITDMRLLFLDKGFLYGLRQVDMPLSQISSVAQKTGLFFGQIEVSTSAGSKTIGGIPRKEVLKICSILAGLVHGEPPKAAASQAQQPVGASATDLASQIERLENLWQKGALTDEEFRLCKAKLIGRDEFLEF